MPNTPLFHDYEAFTEKFKPKKTTDDCYTPPAIYEAVRDWVNKHVCPLEGRTILRPFRPGGDYEHEDYPEGAIVIDNPPFSILASIVRFYVARRIPFFLFAPALTLCNAAVRDPRNGVTAVVANAKIIYENGADIKTSFLTNLWPDAPALAVSGSLNKAVGEAVERTKVSKARRVVKYPANVVTAALLGKLAVRGIDWELPRAETYPVSVLNCGQGLFGGGYLISERLAAERLAAERLAAERLALRQHDTYELDEAERTIIRGLTPKA